MAELTCGNCGTSVAAADVTCPSCGVLLAAYASPTGSTAGSPTLGTTPDYATPPTYSMPTEMPTTPAYTPVESSPMATETYTTPDWATPPDGTAAAEHSHKPLFDLNVTAEDVAKVADGDRSAASLVTVGDEDPLADSDLAAPDFVTQDSVEADLDFGDSLEPEVEQSTTEIESPGPATSVERLTAPRTHVWAAGNSPAVSIDAEPPADNTEFDDEDEFLDEDDYLDDDDDMVDADRLEALLADEPAEPQQARHPEANVSVGATEDYLRKLRERAGIPVDADNPLTRRIERRELSRAERRQNRVDNALARQRQTARDQQRTAASSKPSTLALAFAGFLWLGFLINALSGQFSVGLLLIAAIVSWAIFGNFRK